MESAEYPFISVIIPTYNRREILGQTLQSLGTQDYPLDRFEALVTVDGSTDGTAETLESLHFPFPLHVFTQAHKGPAAARNIGLRNAKGEIILFLDDDTVATRNLFREHVRTHRSGENLVVRGQYLIHPASPPSTAVENHRVEDCIYWGQLAVGLQMPEDAVCDANTSVKIDLLRKAGEFDERFLYQRENVEFGYRLYRAGGRYVYHPGALVYHYLMKTEEDLLRDAYWRGHNDFLLIEKHPDCGGTRELNKLFHAGLRETSIRRVLWQFTEPAQKLSNLLIRWGLFPASLSRTRSIPNRMKRFCAYSKGLKEAGATWKGLARLLRKSKRSLEPRRF